MITRKISGTLTRVRARRDGRRRAGGPSPSRRPPPWATRAYETAPRAGKRGGAGASGDGRPRRRRRAHRRPSVSCTVGVANPAAGRASARAATWARVRRSSGESTTRASRPPGRRWAAANPAARPAGPWRRPGRRGCGRTRAGPRSRAGTSPTTERRPPVGHRGRVPPRARPRPSPASGRPRRSGAGREVVEHGGRRHAVAAADLEHAVGGREVEPGDGPGEAGRRGPSRHGAPIA